MISFVWSARYPFLAGAGGSENYTAGQVRELMRRGISARIITIGYGEQDGRDGFPDIEFLALENQKELESLDDTLVFVIYPLDVKTKHKSYAILHCPPPKFARNDGQYNLKAFRGKRLITASKFAAGLWRRHLGGFTGHMPTVYPFALPAFAEVERPQKKPGEKMHVLFASRLNPDKGIYTLMAALHMDALHNMEDVDFDLTATTSGAHTEEGKVILKLLKAHPNIKVVEARKTSEGMARLMAKYDIVVMPSTNIYWQELFGMVSVEAQHAGCRVVGSRSGGLRETNVGGLMLVEPDNPNALAKELAKAVKLGPLTPTERKKAAQQFTLKASVDSLLKAIQYSGEPQDLPQTGQLRGERGLLRPIRQMQTIPGLISQAYSTRSAYPAQNPSGKRARANRN
jgi:D-inositol-3-phosphate glycosyltransferase